MKKTAVGSRELKTRLGAYLRQVEKGQTLIVTDRGRPVAELKPIPAGGDSELGRLDELVALGILTRKSYTTLARIRPVSAMGTPLSSAVIEDREDRF